MRNSKIKTLRMTQRHQRRMAKIQGQNTASKTKLITGETGRTIRSVAANLTASKGVENITAAQRAENAEKAAASNASAIDLYNRMIAGLGNEGQQGKTQNESTTTVGGSGSKLGG